MSSSRRPGRRTREISSTPASTHTLSLTNDSATPAAKSAARAACQLIPATKPVMARDSHTQVGLGDSIGSSVRGRGVAEGLIHPEQEQRGQNHRDIDCVRIAVVRQQHRHQPGPDFDARRSTSATTRSETGRTQQAPAPAPSTGPIGLIAATMTEDA